MTDERLVIVDPETGEAIDLDGLSDRELDGLHLYLSAMRTEYGNLERQVWQRLRERAIANGGLEGQRRRWTVERRSYQTATPELKREGAQ